jgi:AcrR family transcriptional regulator
MEEADIKDKILKGAEKLFLKYGIRSVSMDDISRHLAVSKKTLYQHFADKEELVLMVSRMHIEKVTKDFDVFQHQGENAIEELALISSCMRKNMEEMNPSMFLDLQKYHPKGWNEWVQHKENFIRASVVRNLKQGIEEGYFRPEINPEIFASYRIASIEFPFDDQIFPKENFNLAEVQSQLFDHFVYGLATDKGRKLYTKYKENNHTNNKGLPNTTNNSHETIL